MIAGNFIASSVPGNNSQFSFAQWMSGLDQSSGGQSQNASAGYSAAAPVYGDQQQRSFTPADSVNSQSTNPGQVRNLDFPPS